MQIKKCSISCVVQLQAGSHEQCMNTVIDHMIQIKANGMH